MKVKKDSEYNRNCGKQAALFFRVRYSSLLHHRENGIYEDVFGFCPECAKGKDKPEGYNNNVHRCRFSWKDMKVLHLRGEVCSVEKCEDDGAAANAVETQRTVHINDVKAKILSIMKTRRNKQLAEDWPEIFRLAWEQFQVESVMKG